MERTNHLLIIEAWDPTLGRKMRKGGLQVGELELLYRLAHCVMAPTDGQTAGWTKQIQHELITNKQWQTGVELVAELFSLDNGNQS